MLGIVDNHSGYHGFIVTSAARTVYGGGIVKLDLGSYNIDLGDTNEQFRLGLDQDLSAINLSLGDGSTTRADALLVGGPDKATFYEIAREHWMNDTWVSVAAGNYGDHTTNDLASSPYTFGVAAGSDEPLAHYSQYHERHTLGIADGELLGSQGTSLASPRVAGSIAEVKSRLDLSNPEALTAFQQTADTVHIREYDTTALVLGSLADLSEPERIEKDEIVDGAYRLFLGVQPPREESEIVAGWDAQTIVSRAIEMLNHSDDVSIMQRTHAAFHVFLHREPELDELTLAVDTIMNAVNENAPGGMEWDGDSWQDFVADFTEYFDETIYHKDVAQAFIMTNETPFDPSMEIIA